MFSFPLNIKKRNENRKKYLTFKYYNNIYNIPRNKIYDSIIPLNIYQTWFTKNLPSKMKERVNILKLQNPEFNHYLYDDDDCYEFIKNNFNKDVLNAYDSLIPGAYKADLWRLCILYINGGFYLDIKLICVNHFKLIELSENEHYVKDRPLFSIFNSFMVCQKGNPFLLESINKIVENVQNKIYGDSILSPTGPKMLGSVLLNKNFRINIDLFHYEFGGYIIYKNIFIISTEYKEYNDEISSLYSKLNTKKYSILWNERNIYK